jgi:outer membrane protein assembly factor BamA
VGGPLSNRAWQIRELGPGSFQDTAALDPNVPFYQTGDFKVDMSVEFRFPLFWYFKGAVFADAANIWTLRPDPARPGANVKSPFAELGMGFGYGVRMDLSYFILRADFGYRLHSPYPIDGSRWLTDRLSDFPGGAEVQIAVGMPF